MAFSPAAENQEGSGRRLRRCKEGLHNEDESEKRLFGTDSGNPSSSSCPIQTLKDELLVNILLRIPYIKCVFRCKCVCKRWLALINPKSDPYFIRMYLSRRADPAPMLCLFNVFSDRPFRITTLRNNRGWFRLTAKENGFSLSFLPIPNPSSPEGIHILGSSDGLILCCPGRYDHSVYFICNPITRLWLSLPPPPLCRERAKEFSGQLDGSILAAFTYEEDEVGRLKVDPASRFRVVCVRARAEAEDKTTAVEVFSSETGEWATCLVPRMPVPWQGASYLVGLTVCSGIAYWEENHVFTAFNPWDGTSRSFPAPQTTRLIELAGQSRGFLQVIICVDAGVMTYEVHVLRNGEWCLEHVFRLRQLVSHSRWLLKYARSRKRASRHTECLAFHPHNADIVYFRCECHIVQCNMRSGVWDKIGDVSGTDAAEHEVVPLMLPWWPTPVPVLPRPTSH